MSNATTEEEVAAAEEEPAIVMVEPAVVMEEPAVVMEEPAVVMEASDTAGPVDSGVQPTRPSRLPKARTAHNKKNWKDEGSKISGLAKAGQADAAAKLEKNNYDQYKCRTKDNPPKTFDQWKEERKEKARKKARLAAAPATPNSAPAAAPAAAAAVFTPNLQFANVGLPSLSFAGASPPPLIGPAGYLEPRFTRRF